MKIIVFTERKETVEQIELLATKRDKVEVHTMFDQHLYDTNSIYFVDPVNESGVDAWYVPQVLHNLNSYKLNFVTYDSTNILHTKHHVERELSRPLFKLAASMEQYYDNQILLLNRIIQRMQERHDMPVDYFDGTRFQGITSEYAQRIFLVLRKQAVKKLIKQIKAERKQALRDKACDRFDDVHGFPFGIG